jgi:hypothetical protein
MLGKFAPGDVVTVTRIDRLARSAFDLFAIVKRIVDAKGAVSPLGRTVGRHRHQHRVLDAGGTRRPRRRRARPDPHPDGGKQEPRQGPTKAHGPPPFPDRPNRKRPSDGARRALRCRNWRTANTAAYPPCGAPRASRGLAHRVILSKPHSAKIQRSERDVGMKDHP